MLNFEELKQLLDKLPRKRSRGSKCLASLFTNITCVVLAIKPAYLLEDLTIGEEELARTVSSILSSCSVNRTKPQLCVFQFSNHDRVLVNIDLCLNDHATSIC